MDRILNICGLRAQIYSSAHSRMSACRGSKEICWIQTRPVVETNYVQEGE